MKVPSERQARVPDPIRLGKLLLVEGETPLNFFDAFTKAIGLESTIEVRSFGGVKQLRAYIKAIAQTTEFKERVRSLAVIRDAEDSAERARLSVLDAISAAQLPNGIKTQVFILPNNSDAGMIESLMQASVEDLPIFECVQQFFHCTAKHSSNTFGAKHRIQVYTATFEDVQMVPGLAATRGVFSFDKPIFSPLKDFLLAI